MKSLIFFLLIFSANVSAQEVPGYLIKEAYERMLYDLRASHILVKLNKDASPEDTLASYNKIMTIRDRIINGEAFEIVAKETSDDPSAKDHTTSKKTIKGNGGEIGYFTVLDMVYPFETGAYSLQVGQVSIPIRTDFGYHLIKVTDRKPAMGKVTVAQIYISVPTDAQPEIKQKYKNKIDNVYTELKNGNNWDDIVTLYSDDKESATKGGQLPSFGVNRMVSEFIIAVSNIKNIADFSEPFQTSYGWHIIKLLERIPIGSFQEEKNSLNQRILKDSRYINNPHDSLVQEAKKSETRDEIIRKENENGFKSTFDLKLKNISTLDGLNKLVSYYKDSIYANYGFFYGVIAQIEDSIKQKVNRQGIDSRFTINEIKPIVTKGFPSKVGIIGNGILPYVNDPNDKSGRSIHLVFIVPMEKNATICTVKGSFIMKVSNKESILYGATLTLGDTSSVAFITCYDNEGVTLNSSPGAFWGILPSILENKKLRKENGVGIVLHEGNEIKIGNLYPGDGNIVFAVVKVGNRYVNMPGGVAGSIHRIFGSIQIGDYIFNGEEDPIYPLTFLLHKDYGYVYLRGRGSVVFPDGSTRNLYEEPTKR